MVPCVIYDSFFLCIIQLFTAMSRYYSVLEIYEKSPRLVPRTLSVVVAEVLSIELRIWLKLNEIRPQEATSSIN